MQKLGDYIREVNNRNKDLEIELSQGICNAKYFQSPKQVADNPQTHKIVRKGQFAYNRATTRNGEKISIALREGSDCTVSSAYQVFEIIDEELLDPKYLMMWFKRPEFDRLAIFYSHGSAHEFFEWDAMCDVLLPIPSIEQQREIVSEYETISKRIKLNEQIIKNLEATAQTLYHKMFVEGIDKENLPEGWRIGTIAEFCKDMKSGGTPSRNNNLYWNKKEYRWLKSGEVHNNIIIDVEEHISKEGLDNSSAKIIPAGTITMAMYGATAAQVAYVDCETTTNQACCNMICHTKNDAAYLFFHLLTIQEDVKKLANGGAQENLSQELIAQQQIILIENKEQISVFVPILDNLIVLYRENEKLIKLQSLLLAKMGK
ncbi:MAG: restriction endonuclease subunit S [Bacteroidales bacterium]|nr:restriction endonuclease subunit S [Bacteroidales bacterium]